MRSLNSIARELAMLLTRLELLRTIGLEISDLEIDCRVHQEWSDNYLRARESIVEWGYGGSRDDRNGL